MPKIGNVVKNNSYVVSQFPFLLLFLVILGMFTNDTQGVLNVSAVILLLYTIYTAVKNKINPWHDILTIVKTRKMLFLFGAWGLFCALFFTYADFTLAALKAFFDDWRYVVIISLFLVVFKSELPKSSKTITYALICTLAFTLFIIPILKQFKDSDLPLYLQLRYGFAHYMSLLFPFTFSAFFLFKTKFLRTLMLFLSILAFLFLLYTGSRGGILAVVIESFFILLLLSSNYKNLIINSFRLGILAISIILVSYYTLPQVKNKIDQTIYSNNITSGRDKIITTRLPIFMNENKIKLVGVGYGSVAYSQYLLDNNAEKKIGRYSEKKKIYVYHNDDPFFLNITYNIGFIGLALFLIAFFINMKDLFKDIRIEKNILNVGIFVSSIGYFLVYCLFEFIFIDIFILYNILTAILIKKVLSR